MVGFSLLHLYPAFAITGALSCDLLMLWLIPAAVYMLRRRHDIRALDVGMVACCLATTVAMVLPDKFFT
jgi:hypothetical protein